MERIVLGASDDMDRRHPNALADHRNGRLLSFQDRTILRSHERPP